MLKVVSDSLDSTECWCFLSSPGKKRYLLYESIGAQAFGLQGKVNITDSERTVFGVCLQRGGNILIKNAHQKSMRNSLPRWFVQNVDLKTFLLLPLVRREKCLGLIFVGWPTIEASERISPRQYRSLENFFQILMS